MRVRALGALAAAAVAVTALAGCQTKIGTAAVVNGTKLTDTQLSAYVTKKAVPFDTQSGQIVPKVFALESWIDVTLFEQTIAQHGGGVTSSERTQYEGVALNGATQAEYAKAFLDKGFTSQMGALRVREQTDFLLLAHRLHPTLDTTQLQQGLQSSLGAQVVAELAKNAKNVSISRRYGSWVSSKIAIDPDAGAGLPPFVTFGGGVVAAQG